MASHRRALTAGDLSLRQVGGVAEGGTSLGGIGLDLGVQDVAGEVGEPAREAGLVGGAGADPPTIHVTVAALIALASALPAARWLPTSSAKWRP